MGALETRPIFLAATDSLPKGPVRVRLSWRTVRHLRWARNPVFSPGVFLYAWYYSFHDAWDYDHWKQEVICYFVLDNNLSLFIFCMMSVNSWHLIKWQAEFSISKCSVRQGDFSEVVRKYIEGKWGCSAVLKGIRGRCIDAQLRCTKILSKSFEIRVKVTMKSIRLLT